MTNHSTPYVNILPNACWKSPERASIYVEEVRGTKIYLERVKEDRNQLIKSVSCITWSIISKSELIDWNDEEINNSLLKTVKRLKKNI